ncbi:hypothetical protein [Desulfopila aestuarii]|uniref:hypothetical protein n=1 Tax=Desulfopila aestuarii TaxID=231440 RepID=UPI0009FF84CD|nr:hypothetical protein [Desulfopila aestuarii]
MVETQPQCRNCKNYFITYDRAKPHGCRALGFKSQRLPSRVVFESSGIACQLFVPKPVPGGKAGSSSSWVA